MEIRGGVGRPLAQRRQRAVLAVDERRELRVGENQREVLRYLRLAHRAHRGLDVVGQRRVAVGGEAVRIQFHFARRRGEAARRAVLFVGVFFIARRNLDGDAAGRVLELIERDAARRELVGVARVDVAAPEFIADAEALGELEDDPRIRFTLPKRRHDLGPILYMQFASAPVLEAVPQRRHFEEGRRGEHVVAERRGRRHEKLRCDGEFQRAEGFPAEARVRAGHDGVRAEVEQGFYRIRPAFENRVVDVVRRAVPRARRRAERLALATDSLRGHLLRQKLPAFHAVHLGFGEDHVAAGTVDVADQRVERRDRAARLRRVGGLADAVPHIHAGRPVVRENLRGLPRLFRRNSRDRRRPVGAELRGNARERRQRRLAWNLARDAANYLLAEEQWPRAIVFRRRGGGIVDHGPVGYLV